MKQFLWPVRIDVDILMHKYSIKKYHMNLLQNFDSLASTLNTLNLLITT